MIPMGASDLNLISPSNGCRPGSGSRWRLVVCSVVYTLKQLFDAGFVEGLPFGNGHALAVLSFSAANKVFVS